MISKSDDWDSRPNQLALFLLVRVALFMCVLVFQAVTGYAQTSLEIQVAADSDDAEEDSGGGVSLNASDLKLGPQQWVGLRFNAVTIPQGAIINSAYVEMRATDNNTESTDLTVFGENVDDASTFSSGSNNLSARSMTVAAVDWSSVESWSKNQWHNTPDLSAIIQEVVSRTGWSDGNDIVILIRSDDLNGKRLAFSHENAGGNKAAKLHVEYVVDGLLGHWAFAEGTGTTAADSTASANDATLQAGATWVSDCLGNYAIDFNGVGANAITSQSFSPPSAGTITFWMQSAGLPGSSSSLFGISDNWEVRQESDGTLTFDLGSAGSPEFVSVSPLSQEDRWYHVVAVFDASDDTFQVYIDGQLDTSGTNGDDMVGQSAGQLSFGTTTGGSDYWEGALRDFRIYANKLTAEEVAELYGIVAYWKLDESSGTVAVDSSGRSNDATYVGSPTLGAVGAYPAKTNDSVQLDGTSQYVTSAASLLNDVEEFTISGWFNPEDISPVVSFFGQNDLVEVGIDTVSNQLELWTSLGGAINATNKLVPGRWKHVAAVGNGTSLTLYVDGREVATGGTTTTTYGNNAEVFKIGEGVMDSAGGYFDGRVDEVQVFDRAMCAEQIFDLYKGSRPIGVRILEWVEVR